MSETNTTVSTRSDDATFSDDEPEQTIRIENIKKSFGDVVACGNINLTVDPDDFVVLLGPSGCGKTTTLRCIAGLEDPDEGTVLIGDKDITDYKPRDRNFAFVFQSIALFPHMSVRKNIQFGLDMKTELSSEEKKQHVEETASVLDISNLLDRKPSELSGGQQQRVSLGRAMVMNPDVFLFDEPFSALDANLRDQMRTEVKQLHKRLETGMIFVTHDQEEAMTLGNKIVVMNQGDIVQKGTPYQIYNDPASTFVARFIGSPTTNLFECTVKQNDYTISLVNNSLNIESSDDTWSDLTTYDGQAVTVGIRPEYLTVGEEEGDFDAEIALIEPQGSRDVVHLSTDTLDLRATTQQGKIVQPETAGVEQDIVSVKLETNEIWVFAKDGERII
jgi:multiple sugar transport system ATP-binding protein